MKTFHTKGTCTLEEWISITDDFILAVQTRHKPDRKFPRTIFVTRDSVVIKRGDQEKVFPVDQCRWWERSVSDDLDISWTIPVPAIVLELRLGAAKSHRATFALDGTARQECYSVLQKCGISNQIPAWRRPFRQFGWFGGAIIGAFGWIVACLMWGWTAPANLPLDQKTIIWQLIWFEFISVLSCGGILVTWERFYVRKINWEVLLTPLPVAMVAGFTAGRVGSVLHMLACGVVAYALVLCSIFWALSENDHTDATFPDASRKELRQG
jgi:hypothetical protein